MSKDVPIVSVIVPTRNSAGTIRACLESIRKQTYGAIELIVVDNHSTDATREIAKEFTLHVYAKGPERSAQRNFGVAQAMGVWVMVIDSDMELTPDVVASCMEVVAKTDECEAVIIPEESFGVGFWAQCKRLEKSFYVGNDAIEAARFFSRSLYMDLGGFNEDLVSGEDWELTARVRKRTKVGRIRAFIRHNEGHLRLGETLRKKYHYATLSRAYFKVRPDQAVIGSGTGPIARYALFFSDPLRLFRRPVTGVGMLFMKTCEYGWGALGMIMAGTQAGQAKNGA